MIKQKGPKDILRLCTNLLESIEDARSKSLCCKNVSRPVIKILKMCTNVLFPTVESSFRVVNQNIDNIEEIESSLISCKKICDNVANETENYFGTFEESICRVELVSVVAYLNLLIDSSVNSEQVDPMEKMCGVAKSHVTSLIPNVISRLFWLRHFNTETNISWEIFYNAFITEYGEHKEYVISLLKSKLVNADDRVEIIQYVRFVQNSSGPYHAFQKACDPGTVVLCTGIVDDSNERSVAHPQIITSLLGLNIIQVACGGQHAAVLTSQGQVYTWGRGGFGRLGHGNIRPSETPLLVETLKDMQTVQVACGFAYTAVVTSTGSLYTWGAGENGRLGLGDVVDRMTPCKVETLMDYRIAGVYAGSVHTCMLTDRGEVYVCGKCEYTGHGEKEDLLYPKILNAFDNIAVKQISVGPGGYHTIALTTRGDVYTWGHNRVGQLGYQNSEAVPRNLEGAYFLPTPHIVAVSGVLTSPEEFKPTQVVAGWGHTSILLEDGRLMMCGRNYQGQLGLGDPAHFPTNERGHPFQPQFAIVTGIAHKRVIQVACGGEHSVALCDDNDLYTVGAGNRGQLGQGHLNGCTEPKLSLPLRNDGRELKQIACGNNCTLVLAGKFQPPCLMRVSATAVKSSTTAMERLTTHSEVLSELYNYVKHQVVIEEE